MLGFLRGQGLTGDWAESAAVAPLGGSGLREVGGGDMIVALANKASPPHWIDCGLGRPVLGCGNVLLVKHKGSGGSA